MLNKLRMIAGVSITSMVDMRNERVVRILYMNIE